MQRQRSPIADGRHSVAVEDYLRALIALDEHGDALSTAGVAAALRVACASVTQMAQRLAGLGLVEYIPYRALRLTEAGRLAADDVRQRHRLMCAYLERGFGYAPLDADAEADRLEHAMSPRLCSRIERWLMDDDAGATAKAGH